MCEVEQVRAKYARLRGVMDERVTRLWAATEAEALGYGGIAVVVQATGISRSRIRAGLRELAEHAVDPPTGPARAQRIRRPGAGRPALVEDDPSLVADLESLVDPVTRGDPESPLRWTCKSKDKLAAELREMGHKVSATVVGRLLHQLDYSLQVVRKTREGKQSPDRNAQFEHINRTAKAFMKRGQPVVSVDTKKKELVGDFKNAGREWQRKGGPGACTRARLHRRRAGQGHPLRRLRHRAQRGVGQRRGRPRHGGVCCRDPRTLVARDGQEGLPRRDGVARHRRRRREQCAPLSTVARAIAALLRCDRA